MKRVPTAVEDEWPEIQTPPRVEAWVSLPKLTPLELGAVCVSVASCVGLLLRLAAGT